jgi:hypothetical protein
MMKLIIINIQFLKTINKKKERRTEEHIFITKRE